MSLPNEENDKSSSSDAQGMDRSPRQQSLCNHRRENIVVILSSDSASMWYYELGPDNPPYAAKFYDFCGAEDPEASSCTTSFCVSYNDD